MCANIHRSSEVHSSPAELNIMFGDRNGWITFSRTSANPESTDPTTSQSTTGIFYQVIYLSN